MKCFSLAIILSVTCVIETKKNVLFIMVDDLRPELGCYQTSDNLGSSTHMYTPNIDAIAGKSLLLKRAYVQQALCSPSRVSLLTSRRPDTTRVYNLHENFREVGGNFTTIPQYFKNHGYISAGIGKIFHPGKPSNFDDPISWNEPYFHPTNHGWEDKNRIWRAMLYRETLDKPLVDTQIAEQAIITLRHFGQDGKYHGRHFFIAVGFHKPHMPFVFPRSFLQYYPKESIHLPDNPYAPDDLPGIAWSTYNELREFTDQAKLNISGKMNTTLPNYECLALRRAYYASVSWIDSLIGDVLQELNSLGLENDTIVTFLSDHGYQLGEHGEWCKHTNFELATRTPLMIRVPGLTDSGIVSDKLTEFVDLFPTLTEAAELGSMRLCPEHSGHVQTCSEGESLMPLIRSQSTPWKTIAFSQYLRNWDRLKAMGYTIRTDRYRYTEWPRYNETDYTLDWANILGMELYDHSIDPDENSNRAEDRNYTSVVEELSRKLRNGWRDERQSRSSQSILIGK